MSSGPQRRGSSRLERRKSSGPYSRSGSTGLTSYLQGSVSFSDEAAAMEADDAVGELKPARAKGSLASKALSAISFGRGSKAPAPAPTLASSSLRVDGTMELSLFKPKADDILGITFEVPHDPSIKGVVVAEIHAGFLMAKAKQFQLGDVVHTINGRPITTPKEGAECLREAKGVIRVLITRAGAKPRYGGGGGGSASSSEAAGSGRSSSGGGGSGRASKRAAEDGGGCGGGGGPTNTTVVVSCSQLILESKRIVGAASGLDGRLDGLYASLKAKELASGKALATLIELVGQTTVEQARAWHARTCTPHV